MQAARTVITLVLLAAAVVVTYALPRINLPHPRRLPVEEFPRQIGQWRATEDNEVTEDVQKALPTAVIVDRQYVNGEGRPLNVILVTASEMRDIHSPAVCLPGSGWVTHKDELVVMEGRKITARVMSFRDSPYHIWYWYPPVPFDEPKDPAMRKLYRWRLTAPGTYRPDTISDLSSSLMVRVMTPDRPGAAEAIRDFVTSATEPLATLASAAATK